ncbi:MAG: class 1 fructose-bisphosphatase [bacterium]|nr:class 1 fructose-bisphosphatase [bacterium]
MREKVITIEQHIFNQERKFPEATGDFSGILNSITLAAKIISREVNKAGLVDVLGLTGEENVHGEEVRKLDEYAQNVFVHTFENSGHLCMMISEESDTIIEIPPDKPSGKYILSFDPLDGSSNIDANVSIGSIFGIFRQKEPDKEPTEEDALQPGRDIVAAGYVIYGSSTMLVYSTGKGVHGFTLDPSIGEFLLSHEQIQTPKQGKIYSVNEGNYSDWDDNLKRYIKSLKEPTAAGTKPYSMRYIGSLVADFHRNLLYGGIFLYPGDERNPDGKLRLLYEAIPLAYVVEQAGGAATDGKRRILDIKPDSMHQKTPLVIGSENDVRTCGKYFQGTL